MADTADEKDTEGHRGIVIKLMQIKLKEFIHI